MGRCFPALAVLVALLASCGRTEGPELSIEVANGFGEQHYRLTCEPHGGDVPNPAELCQLLADNADVMLFRPKNKSECAGGVLTVHLRVRGRFEGRSVDANEIDTCQGNPKAERLWLSNLAAPPQA
jgi:hypothetical protein